MQGTQVEDLALALLLGHTCKMVATNTNSSSSDGHTLADSVPLSWQPQPWVPKPHKANMVLRTRALEQQAGLVSLQPGEEEE